LDGVVVDFQTSEMAERQGMISSLSNAENDGSPIPISPFELSTDPLTEYHSKTHVSKSPVSLSQSKAISSHKAPKYDVVTPKYDVATQKVGVARPMPLATIPFANQQPQQPTRTRQIAATDSSDIVLASGNIMGPVPSRAVSAPTHSPWSHWRPTVRATHPSAGGH
jgi:hypothetical protein